MGNKLITQAILIITSITIIMTYVRPAFGDIADIQDDLARYRSTVSKASELNSALQGLITTERNIDPRDHDRLRTYLPQSINNVRVMRDIQSIFGVMGLTLTTLSSASVDAIATPMVEGNEPTVASGQRLVFRDFELSFAGTYEDLKRVLGALEANAYPLEVVNLSFESTTNPAETERALGLQPGTMQYDLTLRAYALPAS